MVIKKQLAPTTIQEAWLNLASATLILAIKDVRQTRDPLKREKARWWLLSPAAKLFFDALNYERDTNSWVREGCPILGKR